MFDDREYIGKATLTATVGDLTRTFEILCNKKSAGVSAVYSEKVVVKEVYYNVSGIEVSKPVSHDGNVYMIVRTYDDGTTATEKFFNVE